jgi:hypothetical protein
VAAINLFAFVALRGHWDRLVPALALAAGIGVAGGDGIGRATGLELVRIGTFNLLAASVGAQLSMLVVVLLAALAPIREERERPR